MIEKMTKYSMILLKGQQESFLEGLQELGLVDITRSTKALDDTSQKIVADIDLIKGLIQGLQKAKIPEGTQPEHIDGDIVRLAGGMIMRYADDSEEIKNLQKELESGNSPETLGSRRSHQLPQASQQTLQARVE